MIRQAIVLEINTDFEDFNPQFSALGVLAGKLSRMTYHNVLDL
jgi:hypothetical protein